MNTLRVLAAAVALTAAGAAPSLALSASAAHGRAAHPDGVGRVDLGRAPAGRSRFRDDDRSPFRGGTGGWGFAHAGGDDLHGFDGGRREHPRRRGYGLGYPYGPDDPYGTGGFEHASAGEYGAGGFEAQAPSGEGFEGDRAPAARPMASALAPLAYGPGVHDGAYAYGYNGYAQTPPLFDTAGSGGWAPYRAAASPCGC